jgi:Ca2+-binding EF-hand superfamily protein
MYVQVFDRNHSGRISLAELGDVLAGIGHVKATEVSQYILYTVDGEGVIS